MAQSFVMTFEELRAAVDRALLAAEQLLGGEVDLDADVYWHLPVQAAFDIEHQPADLTMGQLSDDLETIREQDEVAAETAWHELAHVIGLLRGLERLALPRTV